MDAEIKAKLEAIRSQQHKELPEHLSLTWEYNAAWMNGASAAWDLAVKHERERIKNVIESAGKYTNGLHNSIFNTILTPEEVKT